MADMKNLDGAEPGWGGARTLPCRSRVGQRPGITGPRSEAEEEFGGAGAGAADGDPIVGCAPVRGLDLVAVVGFTGQDGSQTGAAAALLAGQLDLDAMGGEDIGDGAVGRDGVADAGARDPYGELGGDFAPGG